MSKILKKSFLEFFPFLWSFHVTPSNALQFTPWVLQEMKEIIKSHIVNKFLEDSNFGSNFIDLWKLV